MAARSPASHGSNKDSSNVVCTHFRVGKKIGEGSFGVIFDGQNLLNGQKVAIKFVINPSWRKRDFGLTVRNPEKVMRPSYETNIELTKY